MTTSRASTLGPGTVDGAEVGGAVAVEVGAGGGASGDVRLLGVRHHGPGSARAVLAVLDAAAPTHVLIEWPVDARALLEWIGHDDLEPPVAMLASRRGGSDNAHAFWPLAEFSPEWQAVRWAQHHGATIVAIDAPTDWMLGADDGDRVDAAPAGVAADDGDPLRALAAAGGEPDPERWWDDLVEHRGGEAPAFAAIAEAMAVARLDAGERPLDAVREAHMRRAVDDVLTSVAPADVVVVCGAWHVPALSAAARGERAGADRGTLRAAGLGSRTRRSKSELTWVPWSDRRLRRASGYGAGIGHPGWYRHLFRHPGPDGVARFLVDVAAALRRAGLAVSSDHLIAATRLSEALATLRRRPRPALAELLDSADAVLDDGAHTGGLPRLGGILDELTVGTGVGAVPPNAPQLPLLADVLALQRRLRLKPVDGQQVIELDLRTPSGLGRSHLLHRLAVLGVHWGAPTEGRGTRGTFRETWTLDWDPAMVVRIVEHGAAGLTLAAAAGNVLGEQAANSTDLVEAAGHVNTALLADLPDAVATAVAMLGQLSADATDVGELVDALVPLARAARYGDVRGSDRQLLSGVIDELIVRVLAGLPAATRNLDDESSTVMVERLANLQTVLATLDHRERRRMLPQALAAIAVDQQVNGLVQGRATRLLHDDSAWTIEQTSARLGRALTAGTAPAVSARFVEGFLAGSGTLLVHDHELLAVVDGWISTLGHDAFADTVPLLRRTFGSFEPAERRQLGELLAGGITPPPLVGSAAGLDRARVAQGLRTVRQLLGLPADDPDPSVDVAGAAARRWWS